MYVGLHVKYPLILSDFNETWMFSADFWKILKISNSIKIHPVGAKLFHASGQADGQADMTNLRVTFHNFVNTPKNQSAWY